MVILFNKHFKTNIFILGNTKGMRFETGEILDMTQKICETLKDEIHIWVILKGIIFL